MVMKFSIDMPVVKPKKKVHEVKLSLRVSETDTECVYLQANGKTIMGFKHGMYCKYTDAKQSAVNGVDVAGLVLDRIGKIVESMTNF